MRVYRVILLLLVSNLVSAQIKVKEYFTKDDQKTDVEQSYYYRVGKKVLMEFGEKEKRVDTVFIDTVKTYYTSNNKIRSREVYRDGYLEGPYSFYHINGRLQEKGTNEKGLKSGYVIQWYDKGTVKQALQYFPVHGWAPGEQDSFKIINYWDVAGTQLVKDGNGYCKCEFRFDKPLEEGKVVGGYRDSLWQITGDTFVSIEDYQAGKFLGGKTTYQGSQVSYDRKFIMAEFKGGFQGMLSFLRVNIKYPTYSKRKGDQGRVFVKFTIDANGDLSGLEVLKGVSQELDAEAVRIVRVSNGKWIPGKFRGMPVKTIFVLPVYFKLDS